MSGAARRAVQMVSPSVEAAKRLPPTIKKQSVPNALMKGGAKPIELEYADFPAWLEKQPDRVSSEDVIRHLSEQGPMGRLQRLDAQGGKPPQDLPDYEPEPDDYDENYDPDIALEYAKDTYHSLSPDERKFTEINRTYHPTNAPRLPADTSKPVSARPTWDYTQYPNLTEADAFGWSDDNYREVYWLDPKHGVESGGQRVFSPNAFPDSVDPHNTHIWVRYHDNPDGLDVQNIQSDIGQRIARSDRKVEPQGVQKEIVEGYKRLHEKAETAADALSLPDAVREVMDKYRAGPEVNLLRVLEHLRGTDTTEFSSLPGGILQERSWLAKKFLQDLPPEEYQELMRKTAEATAASKRAKMVRDLGNNYARRLGEQGVLVRPDRHASSSPLFHNDAWKQIPLRHLLLESAERGGAPIRLPLGVNVTGIEQMPRRAAAKMYNRDIPGAMIRILKPLGGGDVIQTPGTKLQRYQYRDENGDWGTYAVRVGDNRERAGTTVIPRDRAVDYIQKYGLPFMSLLLAPAAANNQQQEVR